MLYWITIFPIVLAFLLYFLVPEPDSWLRTRELKRQQANSKIKVKNRTPIQSFLKIKITAGCFYSGF